MKINLLCLNTMNNFTKYKWIFYTWYNDDYHTMYNDESISVPSLTGKLHNIQKTGKTKQLKPVNFLFLLPFTA